jgi:hypothetical protein
LTIFKCKIVAVAAVGLLLMSATACSVSTGTVLLNAVAVSAASATTFLEQNGKIPSKDADLAKSYLVTVVQAVNSTIVEGGTTETDAVKWMDITDIWTQAVLPSLKGVSPDAALILSLVDNTVQAFVKSIPPTAGAMQAHAASAHITKLSFADKRALAGIAKRAQGVSKRLAALSSESR